MVGRVTDTTESAGNDPNTPTSSNQVMRSDVQAPAKGYRLIDRSNPKVARPTHGGLRLDRCCVSGERDVLVVEERQATQALMAEKGVWGGRLWA